MSSSEGSTDSTGASKLGPLGSNVADAVQGAPSAGAAPFESLALGGTMPGAPATGGAVPGAPASATPTGLALAAASAGASALCKSVKLGPEGAGPDVPDVSGDDVCNDGPTLVGKRAEDDPWSPLVPHASASIVCFGSYDYFAQKAPDASELLCHTHFSTGAPAPAPVYLQYRQVLNTVVPIS